MRFMFTFVLLTASLAAHAQREGQGAWLNLDYTYTNFAYSEQLMNEKGGFAGVRGALGLGLTSFLGVSVGGEYQDANLNYNGSTFNGQAVQVITKDYFRDLRAMLHMFYGPMTLSVGVAEREWYDDLIVSYRRRTTYNYYPVELTIYRERVYLKVETDIWKGGKNRSYMSDVNPAEHDVNFTQSQGSGYGAEVGYLVQTGDKFLLKVFVAYHRWDVSDSDTQFDGVYNLVEPKNNTVTISGGIGLNF